MKVFIISALLFALLLGAIAINAYSVKRICDGLLEHTENIELGGFSPQSVEALEKYWGKHKLLIGFSASRTDSEYISKTIVSLRSACDSGAFSDAKRYLALLDNAASDLSRREDISFENLF